MEYDGNGSTGNDSQQVEVVGRFGDRETFQAAVTALRGAGFAMSDLSVLDSHQALTASEGGAEAWKQTLTGLVGEINYIGPITAAGLIMVASGTLGAAIAGLVAAGFTGAAIKELLDEVKATPHTEAFARALEHGALLLWVRAERPEQRATATEILAKHGAEDVHEHRRAAD